MTVRLRRAALIRLFFSGSEESRAQSMEYFKRVSARQVDRDKPTDLATRDAQLPAITRWGIPDPSKLSRLAAITQPVFVAKGDNDTSRWAVACMRRSSYLEPGERFDPETDKILFLRRRGTSTTPRLRPIPQLPHER